MITKLDKQFDLSRLVADMFRVAGMAEWTHRNQISLSCKSRDRGLTYQELAHGSATTLSEQTKLGDEFEYDEFISEFKHTYFYEIWKELREEYGGVYRMRLMLLDQNVRIYRVHQDYYYRYHIPIITNDLSFLHMSNIDGHPQVTDDFQVPSMMTYHLPADGSMYQVNTTTMHTAYNGGSTDRVHLVCSI